MTYANDVALKDGTVRRKAAVPIDVAIFRRHAKSIHGAKTTPRQIGRFRNRGTKVMNLDLKTALNFFAVYVKEDSGGWTFVKGAFRYQDHAERWACRKIGYRTWKIVPHGGTT